MDIIRKLLHGGYSPDLLVKRGATAKYVTAVCEEIVEGTRKRKALWLGPTSTPPSSVPITPPKSQGGEQEKSIAGSPSSEVEILVSMGRRGSLSSEGSAEFELIEKPSPSSNRPMRLVPSSHWAPPASIPVSIPPIRPVASAAPSRPIPIESYKPPSTAQTTVSSSTTSNSFANTSVNAVSEIVPGSKTDKPINPLPFLPEKTIPAGLSKPPAASIPHQPIPSTVSLPPRPVIPNKAPPTEPKHHNKPKKGKRGKKSKDDVGNSDPITLNYDDEEPMLIDNPSTSTSSSISATPIPASAGLPPKPVAAQPPLITPSGPTTFPPWFSSESMPVLHPSFPSGSATLPIPPVAVSPVSGMVPSVSVPKESQADIDAKNAILEARRKVLESMKARKKVSNTVTPPVSASDLGAPPPVVEPPASAAFLPAVSMPEKTIEQEMLDLEAEVLTLQKEAAEEAMDIDEPEEGEITPSSLPLPLPAPAPIPFNNSTSLPNPKRGIKRPNVEDLDARPLSAQSRSRRKPFGGPPMKPSRLMINLDDESESESEDETGASTPVIGLDAVMRMKELQIRLLKEKIAARMREKAAKKAQTDLPSLPVDVQDTSATSKVALQGKIISRLGVDGQTM